MIYHIALTEQADSDLRGIYEYIAFSLVEPENAAGQLDRLKENILKLADMPGKFKLYEKEILGFFGLVGAGRTELARVIFGVDPIGSGEIYVEGGKVKISSPKDAIQAGIGLVPEDRKGLGLILGMSIKDNMLISKIGQFKKFSFE